MDFLPDKLESYILKHIDEEPDRLKQINRDTHEKMLYPRMLSGHLQGRILKMLCRMINPVRILEIGTYTGYSALCMAEGTSDTTTIDTIEINDELESFITEQLKKHDIAKKIHLIMGDALNIIPQLNKCYDLVFIDANKRYYSDYYDLVIDKVSPGGYIIADNVLWSGKVSEDIDPEDEQTIGINQFNAKIVRDKRVEKVIFPVRDGFTVMYKKP